MFSVRCCRHCVKKLRFCRMKLGCFRIISSNNYLFLEYALRPGVFFIGIIHAYYTWTRRRRTSERQALRPVLPFFSFGVLCFVAPNNACPFWHLFPRADQTVAYHVPGTRRVQESKFNVTKLDLQLVNGIIFIFARHLVSTAYTCTL